MLHKLSLALVIACCCCASAHAQVEVQILPSNIPAQRHSQDPDVWTSEVYKDAQRWVAEYQKTHPPQTMQQWLSDGPGPGYPAKHHRKRSHVSSSARVHHR